MATRFVIDVISDDPRKADYVRALLDAVVNDYRLEGALVFVETPLEVEDVIEAEE